MSTALGLSLGQPDAHRAADRLAIADVLATFCIRLDQGDLDAACAIFTEDCVVASEPGGGGPVEGREAVQAHLARRRADVRRTHHQLGQSVITFGAGHDTAEAVTYLTAWFEGHDGSERTTRSRQTDALLRTRDGWRVRRRGVDA